MAKIQFGTIVTGIRGTVGGLTFSANASGPHARVWTRSSNPRSTLQQTSRYRLASNSLAWRSLSSSDQATWIAWAAANPQTDVFGNTYYWTGLQAYVKINNQLLYVGRAVRTTAPSSTAPAAPTGVSANIYVSSAASVINITGAEFTTEDFLSFIAIGTGTGLSVPPVLPQFLRAAKTPSSASVTITTYLAALYGTLNTNQRAFVDVIRQTTDGVRSAATRIITDVVA